MSIIKSVLNTKNIVLKNRLIFPPIGTGIADLDGGVNQKLLDYYNEKSTGGYLSLIIVEHSFVSQQGKASEHQLSAAQDGMIDGLHQIAKVIQHNGVKAILQINHAGAATNSNITGSKIVSPSALMRRNSREITHELSESEIQNIVIDFANAARRAKEAGFDGVEIHSAHGYLLNQFYSPYFNQRRDHFGGSVYGRIKIHLDIIHEIRNMVGSDYPLLLRLGSCDYIDGGTTVEDSKIAAKEFEKASVDILDVSGGLYGFIVPGREKEQGYFSDVTKALKETVSIPVILTGGIKNIHVAEKLLSDGDADLIGVGRPIYKDSLWAKRAMEEV